MTDRRSPTVIAVAGGSPTPLGRIAHLPGLPSGMRIVRIGHRRFQLLIPTTSYTPPRVVIVAVKRNRVRFIDGLEPSTPDRVRADAETGAQLLWERYGRPVLKQLPVRSPIAAVCRRTEADGTVVHRVRLASPALAGHHVVEIGRNGSITYPPGRFVPAPVVAAVEEVAAHLGTHHEATQLPGAA